MASYQTFCLKYNSKSCKPPICNPFVKTYSYTDRDIAGTLNCFLLRPQKLMMRYQSYLISSRKLTLDSVNVTSDQIEALIKSLNLNKASGPDLISHIILKGITKAVSKPLTILFNRALDESIFSRFLENS